MQIKVLGCDGGIGGEMRTTSLLIDDDVLIDAGTGLGDLPLADLLKIKHIFITHPHLDHIAALPLFLDTVMGLRPAPITIYATQAVVDILKTHIFNWLIWPNFNVIPSVEAPFLTYQAITLGEPIRINNKTLTAVPANHTVPAVGYQISNGTHSAVFTGDTMGGLDFWQHVNKIKNLKYLMIETAFSNSEAALALLSKHFCPSTLAADLANATSQPQVYITHLKPGEDTIMQEIIANPSTKNCLALKRQQILEL